MRTWLIANADAGGAGREDAAAVLRRLRGRPDVYAPPTGDVGSKAREAVAAGADLVIAAGGDGTVSAVVNGLAGGLERTRLGILPLGTANDFARTLGIPTDDLEASAALFDQGGERRVDLMWCDSPAGERLIINASTGGFSVAVHDKLTPQTKQAWGPLAYLRAALDAAPEMCFHDARMLIDNDPLQADTCSIVVANGRSAGGMELNPDARVDDGRIDLIVVTAQTFLEELRLATRFLAGTHLQSEHIIHRKARRVRIETEPPMQFSSDGELIGATPIEFEVRPHALRVVAPSVAATSRSH